MQKLTIYIRILIFFIVVAALPFSAEAGYVRPIVFPVNGTHSFQDDFANPRSGGREHLGIDIIASKMTPVVAAADGVISYVVSPQAYWGYALYLRDADGYQYRYLHLNNDTPGTDDGNGGEVNAYAPGIARGVAVTKGQLLGWVGDSGNAEGTVSHLHFEMYDPTGSAFSPYESLLAATPPSPLINSPVNSSAQTVVVIPAVYSLIKYEDDPAIFLLANGVKQKIVDEATFKALGFQFSAVRLATASEQYRSGIPIQVAVGVTVTRADGGVVAAPANNPYVFTKLLTVGSTGEEVRQLQLALKSLGYFTYPSVTGYFGSLTRDAVLSFQKAKGISPVGFVGPATRAALNLL